MEMTKEKFETQTSGKKTKELEKLAKKRRNLGTKEEGWADKDGKSFGIDNWCPNGCWYCWSRLKKSKRMKNIDYDTFPTNKIPRKTKEKIVKLSKGRYMFPSTHDIHPENQVRVLKVCLEILQKGNDLLITTKPRYEVVKYLTSELVEYKNNVEFRFSIGSMNDEVLQRWEPNASLFSVRRRSLKLAFLMGYRTSIVMEPYLDENPDFVVRQCHAFVTEDFWVGKMNYFSELIRKHSDLKELGWLYTKNRMLEIKKKLDKIEYASIRYKNQHEWDELEYGES